MPTRRSTALVAVSLALATGGPLPARGASPAAGCTLDQAARDAWYRVPAPGSGAWSYGMVDDDPCVLVAASSAGRVERSANGGRSWREVARRSGGLVRVLSEGLGSTVVVADPAGGALVSVDGGATFRQRQVHPNVEGVDMGAGDVVAAARHGDTLLLAWAARPVADTALRPPATTTLYTTTDGGATVVPLAGSVTVTPVAVAYDTVSDAIFVANDRPYPGGGVWRSTDDGRTFQQATAMGGTTTDVNVTPLPGGGRVVYGASTTGVWDSVDGGSGWAHEGATPVRALRPEHGAPGVVTALVGSPPHPGRSTDSGASFAPNDAGIPASCAGRSLTRTTGVPSFFLVGCADGTAYRYLSSGSDLPGALPPGGGPSKGPDDGGVDPILAAPTNMRLLKVWQLPGAVGVSGSIAFDGATLYYGDVEDCDDYCYPPKYGKTVHRIDGRSGAPLPAFQVSQRAFGLDVDRDTRDLFVETNNAMYATRLGGGTATGLFKLGAPPDPPELTQYSWDATLRSFWTFGHGNDWLYRVSREGEVLSQCTWGTGATGYFVDRVSGGAAIAAAGDGTAYVELEDDRSVLRISKSCAVEAVFQHDAYSEVGAENDAMTCDTNSFPQSAIWIRDGDKKTVSAYEIPGAYCPLPTRIAVAAPPRLAVAARATACTRLTLPWGPPVANEDVALFADSMPLGRGTTDSTGRLCLPYVPSLHHKPGSAPTGRKPVQAVFLGTRAFRASAAATALDVLGPLALPAPLPKAAVPPVADPPPPPLQQPAPQPAPHVQAAVRQAQSQAQAQAQAQAQPVAQANPNPVVVAQQQEQPQLATVDVDAEPVAETGYAMVPRRRPVPSPAPFWLAVSVLTTVAAFRLAYQPSYRRDSCR